MSQHRFQFSPTKVLIATAGIIAASTALLPLISGYGTILFQFVALGAWSILAALTSGTYADTHHPLVWSIALAINLALFLIPALGIWLPCRRIWPIVCSAVIVGWSIFYLASLFMLFPATDGP